MGLGGLWPQMALMTGQAGIYIKGHAPVGEDNRPTPLYAVHRLLHSNWRRMLRHDGLVKSLRSPRRWGVECTLAVIGTGGPVGPRGCIDRQATPAAWLELTIHESFDCVDFKRGN
eukprot:9178895-Pyramimonas_sp.AAC.1